MFLCAHVSQMQVSEFGPTVGHLQKVSSTKGYSKPWVDLWIETKRSREVCVCLSLLWHHRIIVSDCHGFLLPALSKNVASLGIGGLVTGRASKICLAYAWMKVDAMLKQWCQLQSANFLSSPSTLSYKIILYKSTSKRLKAEFWLKHFNPSTF